MNREQRREKGAAEDESRSVAEMAVPATSVVVLDRGNNTTCTVNLHGKYPLCS